GAVRCGAPGLGGVLCLAGAGAQDGECQGPEGVLDRLHELLRSGGAGGPYGTILAQRCPARACPPAGDAAVSAAEVEAAPHQRGVPRERAEEGVIATFLQPAGRER